jgi:hypothetical protein
VRRSQPPLEYLMTCSQSSLEGFELARLNEISHFREEFRSLHEEWIEAEIAARLARMLLEGRRAELQSESHSGLAGDPIPNSPSHTNALPRPGPAARTVERFSLSLFAPSHSEPCRESEDAPAPTHVPIDQQIEFREQAAGPLSDSSSSDALPIQDAPALALADPNMHRHRSSGANRARRRAGAKYDESSRLSASHSRECALRTSCFLPRELASNALFVAGQIRPLRQLLLFQTRRHTSSNLPLPEDVPSEATAIGVRIFVSALMPTTPEIPKTPKYCSASYRAKSARR